MTNNDAEYETVVKMNSRNSKILKKFQTPLETLNLFKMAKVINKTIWRLKAMVIKIKLQLVKYLSNGPWPGKIMKFSHIKQSDKINFQMKKTKLQAEFLPKSKTVFKQFSVKKISINCYLHIGFLHNFANSLVNPNVWSKIIFLAISSK